jgi:MFS family permease
MMVQSLILTALTWSETVQIWQVYLMAFMLGAVKAVDTPARQSYVVEMVEGKEDLGSAIGLNSAINNGAKTLGPALAGVAVATMGESMAFLINSLSFLAVIISLLMMTDSPSRKSVVEPEGKGLEYVLGGLRYILRRQTVLILVSLVAFSSFLSKPYQTLLPVFADTTVKASSQPVVDALCSEGSGFFNCKAPEALPLGLLFSSVGLGAVVGALLVASLPEKAVRGKMLTLGNISAPLFVLLFVFMQSLIAAMIFVFFVGMSNVFQKSMVNTLLQISVPDELRGRVMSVYSLVSQGMTRMGGLQAGFSADLIGAPAAVGLGAAICLGYGMFVAVRYQEIRKLA